MSSEALTDWVLPASIPFSDLKGRDLEECLYWLLDAMGAKDLEWRTGGKGGGAADQGRDLEAHFYGAAVDGELEPQTWWIECKGRSGTVEAEAVKAAVNNALATREVDYLVIATNTQFSNPIRDWVKTWQGTHPRPKVKLWDAVQLERYLSRHPIVVLRLFAGALSLQGRFHAMESRFWNNLEYSSAATLAELWKARSDIEVTPLGLFAAVANEIANGSITQRPWAVVIEPDDLAHVLSIGFANAGFLTLRSLTTGADQKHLRRAFAYLILVATEVLEVEDIAELITTSIGLSSKDALPDYVRDYLVVPIMGQLLWEIQEVCVSDCQRISRSGTDRFVMEENNEFNDYWLRLGPAVNVEDDKELKEIFQIEIYSSPCNVGFTVSKKKHCPLFAAEPTISNIADVLRIIKRVAAFRKAQAAEKRPTRNRIR